MTEKIILSNPLEKKGNLPYTEYILNSEVVTMVTKNQILNLTVEDVTSSGDGVCKYEGYPLFVKGGVTGDVLEVTVTKTNKTYGFGRINRIVESSPHRQKPICPVFEKCGGCDYMHIDYAHQLEIKANTIVSNMQKIGSVHPGEYEFEGVIGADNTLYYRNKSQLPLGKRGKGIVFGFFSKGSHEIVPVTHCAIQDDVINRIAKVFLDYATGHHLTVYDEKSHKGILRHLYVRTGNKTNDVLAVIVTNSSKPLPDIDLLAEELKKVANVKGLVQNINTQKTNLILGSENRILWGENKIFSYIGDLVFSMSSESFFQVNGEQTEKLYGKALEYAFPEKDETVFDLYCGTGSISLFLAKKAHRVIGVEIVEKAIENAKENAKLNGIENASFYAGDCAEVTKELLEKGENADIVVVDPPRKGCSEDMIKLIGEISPKKLVYVSCNSATLARDVKMLKEYGYRLKKVCGVDMFPNTGHVEAVALLQQLSLPDGK